jgi:very-short-patch-repair endonuclease
LGKYIVDFVCHEKSLIVEVDGGQHMETLSKDDERTAWLESKGYQVIRSRGEGTYFSSSPLMGED